MNGSSLFTSDRSFVVFSYAMSHGLLLLRSRKLPPATPTRLDILFKDVRALEIRCWFDGLTIEEVGVDFLQGVRSNPAPLIERGNKVYALKSTGWVGFVVGGIVSFHEDQGPRGAVERRGLQVFGILHQRRPPGVGGQNRNRPAVPLVARTTAGRQHAPAPGQSARAARPRQEADDLSCVAAHVRDAPAQEQRQSAARAGNPRPPAVEHDRALPAPDHHRLERGAPQVPPQGTRPVKAGKRGPKPASFQA